MKKYLKITLLVIIAIILVGTFVFLYQKSKPKVIVYETLAAEVTDLEKTTVATGKVEPRDEILIKPQISGIVDEVFKEAGQSVKKGEVIAKVKVIPELGQLNSAWQRSMQSRPKQTLPVSRSYMKISLSVVKITKKEK